MMSHRKQLDNLPDEAEYPSYLTENYELLEQFSSDENSETLLVRRKEDGLLCTAKCFTALSPLFSHPEPEALKALRFPPMPAFIEEYSDDSMRCILREYIPGQTLRERAFEGPFRLEEIIETGKALCSQLTVLHSLHPPVIHRDIKPGNVILREDGQAVLIDFGIARQFAQDGADADTVAFGTRGFAPPEQYGFRQTDERSDLYSLGALLSWMLRGEPGNCEPAEGVLPDSIFAPTDPEQYSEKRDALESVIAKCTAFDPAQRYASAEEVRQALLALEYSQDAPHGTEQADKGDSIPSPDAKQTETDNAADGIGIPGKKKPEAGRLRLLAAAACIVLLAGAALWKSRPKMAHFQEPLLEEAARESLGLSEKEPLTSERLSEVKGLYIIGDRVYPDADAFYEGISDWYASDDRKHGAVTSLTDVTEMPNLEQICVAAEEIRDLSPVTGLTSLNKLEVKHNMIDDISALSGMENLTSVGINDNPVEDLSPLLSCPSLAFLDLCDVQHYDETVIGKLGDFTFLDLSNPTESYRYLGGKHILSLRLAWTGIRDLSDLSAVAGLEELDLSHTDVTDLTPLSVHTGLKRLHLAAVPAKDLSVLLRLPALETVTLSQDMRGATEALSGAPFEIFYE